MTYTIAITGANGFLGSFLTKHFTSLDCNVIAMQRSAPTLTHPLLSSIRYSLNESFDTHSLERAEVLIHSAMQPFGKACPDSDNINIEGTRELLAISRKLGTKFIFLSSFSAHADALSHYGKHKFQLEKIVTEEGGSVLKLGLVLGHRGTFGSISKLIKSSNVIPLFDGGKQLVQTVSTGDICRAIASIINKNLTGLWHLAEPHPVPLRELYRYIAKRHGVNPLFVPIPLALVLPLMKFFDQLRVKLPLTTENALGLKQMRSFDTQCDLDVLEIELTDYRKTLDFLFDVSPLSQEPTGS